jgi:hypothetical protein
LLAKITDIKTIHKFLQCCDHLNKSVFLSFGDERTIESRLMDFLDSHDTGIIIENIGSAEGLFFVEDATEATDNEGRKIIAAQDFVADYSVKSVFGIGGAYDDGQLLVVVVFCRDAFSRTTAEHFLTLANLFQSQTNALVSSQQIFANR